MLTIEHEKWNNITIPSQTEIVKCFLDNLGILIAAE